MVCELCESGGGEVLWRNQLCRVVLVEDHDYPGFCRVILNRHIKEMTDLEEGERSCLMAVLFAVERALRLVLQPDKINLASLGNMTPHVHWHLIPRFVDDRHFPNPIWGEPKREASGRVIDLEKLRSAIRAICLDLEATNCAPA